MRPVLQRVNGLPEFAAFSPDNSFVVTVIPEFTRMYVWDWETAHIIRTHRYPAFSQGELQLRDVEVDDGGTVSLRGIFETSDPGRCQSATLRMDLFRSTDWQVDETTRPEPCPPKPEQQYRFQSPDGSLVLHLNTQIDEVDGTFAFGSFIPAVETIAAADAVEEEYQEGDALELSHPPAELTFGAAMSPSGKRLALLHSLTSAGQAPLYDSHGTLLTIFDLEDWRVTQSIGLRGYYQTGMAWLDDDRIFLPGTEDPRWAEFSAYPSLIVSTKDEASTISPIDFRCGSVLLPDGAIIGATLGYCSIPGDQDGLEIYRAATGWQTLGNVTSPEERILYLYPSPDGKKVAVLVGSGHQSSHEPLQFKAMRLVDIRSGDVLAQTPLVEGESWPLVSFTPDGKQLGIMLGGENYVWDPASGSTRLLSETEVPATQLSLATANAGRTSWYEQLSDEAASPIFAVRIVNGRKERRKLFDVVVAEGDIAGSPLRWVMTESQGFVLWRPDTQDVFADPEILQTLFLGRGTFEFEGDFYTPDEIYDPSIDFHFGSRASDGHTGHKDPEFISMAPDGRYDSNLRTDFDDFFWNFSDEPMRIYSSEAFIRGFYEPRLGSRLLACHANNSCEGAFRPVTTVGELNRVMPEVRILGHEPGSDPFHINVTVEVAEGVRMDTPNGRTKTGVYDLRLLRDGRLVAQSSGRAAEDAGDDLESWREAHRIETGPDAKQRFTFNVQVPTGAQSNATFEAYAFNEDRVKSDTAWYGDYIPPYPWLERERRIFVIAMGIDAYDEPRMRLNFAANDARLIGSRLATLADEGDVRMLVLADDGANSSPDLTRAALADIFGILGGAPRDAALARLERLGIDARMLDEATPDDFVIVSYSGHGWADQQNNFYIVPSDARWENPLLPPDLSSLVSTTEIARLMRSIDAREMTLIIDACQSAASIDNGDFRAGPLGDAGLGQLAYDKQMRILAATQADDVALESSRLRQGLLSYALANEGLTEDGGLADYNRDGVITMGEWLRYGARRLPSLSRDIDAGRLATGANGSRGVVYFNNGNGNENARVQEPALFDFASGFDGLELRRFGS